MNRHRSSKTGTLMQRESRLKPSQCHQTCLTTAPDQLKDRGPRMKRSTGWSPNPFSQTGFYPASLSRTRAQLPRRHFRTQRHKATRRDHHAANRGPVHTASCPVEMRHRGSSRCCAMNARPTRHVRLAPLEGTESQTF